MAEGTLGCNWIFGHQGAGLFSKKNPKLAVLAVLRGPMKKIRPLCLGKSGVFVY